MSYRLHILVIMALLVALVTGCGGMHRYDARLAAADSLMHDVPDSALALVQAVDPASLTREGDRAYRDLLLTQARYRCYITATSDSDINRALAYYRHHDSEREKLTRAYIYKGAVMEELGHPDSAMLYYKDAETTAAPDDYFNLGYTKLRIAELYQDQISQDSSAICKLKDAIKLFKLINDTTLVISALGKLGAICGDVYPDSAVKYLRQAIDLAKQFNPTLQYSHKSTLSGLMLFQGEYETANKLAMDIVRNGSSYCNETQFYYYAASSYVKLGHLDSAKYILLLTPTPIDAVDSLAYYNINAEIFRSEGNNQLYNKYLEASKQIAIRILSNSQENSLISEEKDFEKQLSDNKNIVYHKRNSILNITLMIALVLLLTISVITLLLYRKIKVVSHEKSVIKQELESSLEKLKQQQLKSENQSVSVLLRKRLSAIQELYDSVRVKWTEGEKVKRIIPLSGMLKSLNENKLLMNVELSDSFWRKMMSSVDDEMDGIVSFVEKNYPNLSKDDIKLFCLLCAKISPQIIRLCMKFDNPKTVTNYRSKIIKKKIGLDMSFDDFVEKYLNQELGKV